MGDIQRIHVFVDGNYLFFSARALGALQDFARLEDSILQKFGGSAKAIIASKHFYTRPPEDTDPRGVLGWLRSHGWKATTFNYSATHQDSIYVNMIHDMWRMLANDVEQDVDDWFKYESTFVVISGSGALAYPLATFPKAVVLACLDESTNKRLKAVERVLPVSLQDLL